MRPLEPGLSLRSYRLVRRLGVGGGGEVWLARDAQGQEVALKARPRQEGTDERRFRQEFEKLRTLRLPSVVRVLDTGADLGYIFFTMDVAKGEPFHRYVAGAPTLAERVQRAAAAGAGVARALAGIHRRGLAHRDVKPANLVVDESGRVTVLDFGTLRFGAASDSTSEIVGTVAYMSPEQRVGLPHDQRVDCYALGVTLHEAVSGVPAARWKPGRPRSSLALLGREVPLALAALVDRLVALDPAVRPSAEEAQDLLSAVAQGTPPTRAAWPVPLTWWGDATPLIGSSAMVVGPRGSGRRRMVEEARWEWYRRGYRAVSGRCDPDRPFSAFRDLLAEIFVERDPAGRRELAADEAAILHAVWPDLPLAADRGQVWPPDPLDVASALAAVLGRRAPIAIVLWDADHADIGTAAVLAALARHLPSGVIVWGTSSRPVAGLPSVSPPPWSPQADSTVLPEILPPGVWPEGPPGETPLQTCARAWRVLARWRGENGPAVPLPAGLAPLAILPEPFPREVARALSPEVDELVRTGHLVVRAGVVPPEPQVVARISESPTRIAPGPRTFRRDTSGAVHNPREAFGLDEQQTEILSNILALARLARDALPPGEDLTEVIEEALGFAEVTTEVHPRADERTEILTRILALDRRATEILPRGDDKTEVLARLLAGDEEAAGILERLLARGRDADAGPTLTNLRCDLAFADQATWELARAAARDEPALHARAAGAWQRERGVPDRALRIALHLVRAGNPRPEELDAAIRLELDRDLPAEVDRWLHLKDLYCGEEDDFLAAYARLWTELELRPGSVSREDLHGLRARATTREQRGLAAYLMLILEGRQGDRKQAVASGHQWVNALAPVWPAIAANMLLEVARARLREGEGAQAVKDCKEALSLARTAAQALGRGGLGDEGSPPLTQTEVNAGTTLTDALIASGRYREAAEFCSGLAGRCREAGLARGEGALLANLATVEVMLGRRGNAAEAAARCRAVQPQHRDPEVLARCAFIQARLAVEVGDLASGRPLIDEASNAAQATAQDRILANCHALALETAVQAADAGEARRVIAAFDQAGVGSEADVWPAALARWLWMVGDLDAALEATTWPRRGYAELCVRAERCRLLLVSGRFDAAARVARQLAAEAESAEVLEIATLARLVAGAAAGAADGEFAPLVAGTRGSRWVHLYLGALHLDAIRRQLRGENVAALIRQFRARSRDVGHRLYEALAREDGW